MDGSLLVSVERETLCDPEWHVYNLLTITSEYAPHIQDSFVKLPLRDSNDERDTLGDLEPASLRPLQFRLRSAATLTLALALRAKPKRCLQVLQSKPLDGQMVSCTGRKLQALVYDILPSTTAVFSYATGSRKLSANEQFSLVLKQ